MNEEAVIYEAKRLVEKAFAHKYKGFFSKDEMISEAYFWLSAKGRIDKIVNMWTESGFIAASTYMRVSLSRLFSSLTENSIIKSGNEFSENVENNWGMQYGNMANFNNSLPFEDFKIWIKNPKNAEMALLEMSEYVSVLQKEAIYLSYIKGLSNKEASMALGISIHAFHNRNLKGLKGIYTSSHFQQYIRYGL